MLRRTLLLVPLLTAAAAVAGTRVPDAPVAVGVAGAVVGLAVAGVLAAVADRRVRRVADRVVRLAAGDTQTRITPSGSVEWRRLVEALNAVGRSLQQRFDELAGERARVERLLDAQPAAIMLFTAEGLAFANPAARRLFHVGRRAAGTPLRVLGVPALADAVAEVRATADTVELEVWRDDRALVCRVSEAAPGEVVLVTSDVTEARRVDAIRRDFVTNASHELKTPVAGMQALADSLALALEHDRARAARMVGRVQAEAARLAQLVRDLLDLARLEEADGRVRQRLDVAGIVRAQAEHLAPLAEQRSVTVDVVCPEPAIVVASPADVRLIVANLLENAIQYNREGGRVEVRAERIDGEVVVEVDDTGVGIPEADRDRIFERFYRVDKARSRAVGGTGLGLAIVRHAAQRHGGEVSVRSVLGEGSRFRVVFPVEGSQA